MPPPISSDSTGNDPASTNPANNTGGMADPAGSTGQPQGTPNDGFRQAGAGQVPEVLRTAAPAAAPQTITLNVHGQNVDLPIDSELAAKLQQGDVQQLQKHLAGDASLRAASAKEREVQGAIALQADMRAWKDEGDPDAFRRVGAALGYEEDHIEDLINGMSDGETDDEDVTQSHRQEPTEIGYSNLAPDVQRALKIVEHGRIAEIVDKALDSDKEVRYNMEKLSDKGRAAIRQLVDDKIAGRLADVGGDFGDNGTRILRDVIPEIRNHLVALDIPDKNARNVLSAGPSPGGGGTEVYPAKEPDHVSSKEGTAFDAHILECLAYNMGKDDRGAAG